MEVIPLDRVVDEAEAEAIAARAESALERAPDVGTAQ